MSSGRDKSKQGGSDETYQKPRRLDEETANYLLQIEPQLKALNSSPVKGKGDEMNESDENDGIEKEVLVGNVLEEIKHHEASAMSDRRTNLILEKLCYASSLNYLVDIITSITPYAVFLARDRYSSHCLQALFARFCYILKNFGVDESQEENVKEKLLAFCQPILSNIVWLSKDLNASHVVRAIICVLSGVPIISERKGKGSKHPHSVSLSESLDKILHEKMLFINNSATFDVPDEFNDLLGSSVIKLIELSTHELQAMAADPTSAAVLGLLERIFSNPTIIEGGNQLIDRFNRRILNWSESDDEWINTVYAMAGDRAGSYLLESMIECCSSNLFIDISNKAVIGKVKEYALDNVANFVVQALLRRLSLQLNISKSEEGFYQELLKLSHKLLEEFTTSDAWVELCAKKGGVVLWVIEVATTLSIEHKDEAYWSDRVVQLFLVQLLKLEKSATEDEMSLAIKDLLITRFTVIGSDNQLLLARQLGSVLKAMNVSTTAKLVCSEVCNLPANILLAIATSGPISRLILDNVIDSQNSVMVSALLTSLTPVLIDIATHFIGQHIFRKLFFRCDLSWKEKIVKAMIHVKETLQLSKEGRASYSICQCDIYIRKPIEWRQLVNKQEKASALMEELEHVNKPRTAAPSTSDESNKKKRKIEDNVEKVQDDDNEEGDENQPEQQKEKRKRKRKRPNKGVKSSSEEVDVADV